MSKRGSREREPKRAIFGDCGQDDHIEGANACQVQELRNRNASLHRDNQTLRRENQELKKEVDKISKEFDLMDKRASEYLKMATDAQGELARTIGRLIDEQKKNKKLKEPLGVAEREALVDEAKQENPLGLKYLQSALEIQAELARATEQLKESEEKHGRLKEQL
ncbi:hypothetical protein N7528_004270 [Penicillium herquei]|nr:hypothetical protein N7528_004270 [Penicillium herquei]